MNIFKLRVNATDCAWLAADKIEFVEVVNATTVDLRILGTSDDLAFDEVAITTDSGKSADVAAEISRYMHDKGKKSGVVDVAAISGVASIGEITAA